MGFEEVDTPFKNIPRLLKSMFHIQPSLDLSSKRLLEKYSPLKYKSESEEVSSLLTSQLKWAVEMLVHPAHLVQIATKLTEDTQ